MGSKWTKKATSPILLVFMTKKRVAILNVEKSQKNTVKNLNIEIGLKSKMNLKIGQYVMKLNIC